MIESRMDILGGKPCIKNTRISVEIVLEWLASGASHEDIILKHPQITKEDINRCIQFASDALKNSVYIEIQKSA